MAISRASIWPVNSIASAGLEAHQQLSSGFAATTTPRREDPRLNERFKARR